MGPPRWRGAQNSSQQVVACGVTAYLFTYTTSSSDRYMAYIALRLDATHALGMRATLTSLSQMPTLSRFVNSVSFPFPECVGGPPHPADAPHAKTAKAAKAAGLRQRRRPAPPQPPLRQLAVRSLARRLAPVVGRPGLRPVRPVRPVPSSACPRRVVKGAYREKGSCAALSAR